LEQPRLRQQRLPMHRPAWLQVRAPSGRARPRCGRRRRATRVRDPIRLL